MNSAKIDINCDMGESFGNFTIGNDEKVFPYISSCNIACGFHGGDPWHIEQTIKGALTHGLQIGAHPSYPDLAGFGRRFMQVNPEELKAIVKYQVAALKGMTESLGGKLAYVKPHGALYNTAARQKAEALAIIGAIQDIDPTLILMGLAGSPIEVLAGEMDIPFVAEAFADRKYMRDGSLRSRTLDGAVIESPEEATAQVLSIVLEHGVQTYDGTSIPLKAQSICIHGDNRQVEALLQAIDAGLAKAGILKTAFSI